MIGTTLSHFKITAKLGEGGMGEVYQATDTKLDREVAVKLLAEAVSRDPERLARFEREAKVLAALDHPNIAAIYGLEEVEGRLLLVMQLAEGEDLQRIIAAGGVELETAISIALQLTEALEAAHERGIVHRDLKPANIVVAGDGRLKVLDFGLAKAMGPGAASGASPLLSQSPTLTQQMTAAGVLLGTASYMSPEQARGLEVDRRTDIWSFGCVLYEMLAGERPFSGGTTTDVLAGVLQNEPDWETLPTDIPAGLRSLIGLCLRKDSRQRLRDIGDARIRLEELSGPTSDIGITTEDLPLTIDSSRRNWLPWALVALFGIFSVALVMMMQRSTSTKTETPSAVFSVQLSQTETLPHDGGSAIALSPDGRYMVFVGEIGGESRLLLRALNELEARTLPGTEGGEAPFFSPDGRWIGFFSGTRLKKVSITGGAPVTVATGVSNPRGGTWASDGSIVYTPVTNAGLVRVSEDGGPVKPLTSLDAAIDERSHRWPHAIAGRSWVMFVSQLFGGNYEDGNIDAVDVSTGERRTLYRGGSFPLYSHSGHLLFARGGKLLAAPFDLSLFQLYGEPRPVVEDLLSETGDQEIGDGSAQIAVAQSGLLAYRQGQVEDSRMEMVLVDRDGEIKLLQSDLRDSSFPRFSPDGRRIVWIQNASPGSDLFAYDLQTRRSERLSEGSSSLTAPAWTKDGRYIVFSWSREGKSPDLYRIRADGAGGEELVLASEQPVWPGNWTPDNQVLVYQAFDQLETDWDLWTLTLGQGEGGEALTRELLRSNSRETNPVFSPDGRWLAFDSNESGEDRVYVIDVEDPTRQWRVSTGLGRYPRWSADGKELFYQSGNRIMGAAVNTAEESFSVGPSRELISGNFQMFSDLGSYDVSPDGQTFVVFRRQGDLGETELSHVVLRFDGFEELERLVPTAR